MLENWKSLVALGLAEDLLPCAQPWVTLSENSKIDRLGKTPSILNRDGKGAGIINWAQHVATREQILKWSSNKDYGICVQTRRLRAIDIDIKDPFLSLAMLEEVKDYFNWSDTWYRYRDSTGKMLIPVWVDGTLAKHTIRTENGIIEFLGNGQQFVAYGLHPDDLNDYKWYKPEGTAIHKVGLTEYIAFMNHLSDKYGSKRYQEKNYHLVRAEDIILEDPIAVFLYEKGKVLDSDDTKLYITCPWNAEHSTESLTSTVYMSNGHRGLPGAFKCLHAHCEKRTTYDFLQAVGFDNLQDYLPEDKEAKVRKRKNEKYEPEYVRIAEFNGLMLLDKNGKFKDDMVTISNWLCHPKSPIQIKYDNFTGETYVFRPDDESMEPLSDSEILKIRRELQNNYNFMCASAGNTRDAITAVGYERRYDSAIDWLSSIEWDGVSRVGKFCSEYMGCKDDEYSRHISRYIFTAIAGRIIKPGCMIRIVPIFISNQEDGKTSALRALAPSIRAYASISMKSSDDDLARLLRGVIIAEWEEVRGANDRDANALKAFISKQADKWIPKYKEFSDQYNRRFFMIGTGNPGRFLSDSTGHSRFAPIRLVTQTRWQEIEGVRDQLYAEGLVMFNEHGVMWQGLREYLKLNTSVYGDYVIIDPWEPRVRKFLKEKPEADNDELFIECLGRALESCTQREAQRLENIRTRIATGC